MHACIDILRSFLAGTPGLGPRGWDRVEKSPQASGTAKAKLVQVRYFPIELRTSLTNQRIQSR